MLITINETGKLVLKEDSCLLLHSLSAGKVYVINEGGEIRQWQKIVTGDNIIDLSRLQSGSYALRIENKNNQALSSFEIQSIKRVK
jgi:hypothetical protein